ncbi:hypothetical protein V6N13_086973 [Hibiscus sabdariffa]|uniref:Secreted protein n=1 Tax=Hibiscus sabdariffa TaxID=183260 RepID=A0ABR2FUT9_9ROSI
MGVILGILRGYKPERNSASAWSLILVVLRCSSSDSGGVPFQKSQLCYVVTVSIGRNRIKESRGQFPCVMSSIRSSV